MVKLSLFYILSQIFVIISYILLLITYQLKNRKSILIFNFISLIATGLSFLFLSAWSGLAMIGVAITRNIIFMLDKNRESKNITSKDVVILCVLYLISIIFAILTYDGFLSLMSVFATMLYTYSVWQKDIKTYKLLGVPTEIIWVVYNVYIMSVFGIILEVVVLFSAIVGLIREKNGVSLINKEKEIALANQTIKDKEE